MKMTEKKKITSRDYNLSYASGNMHKEKILKSNQKEFYDHGGSNLFLLLFSHRFFLDKLALCGMFCALISHD